MIFSIWSLEKALPWTLPGKRYQPIASCFEPSSIQIWFRYWQLISGSQVWQLLSWLCAECSLIALMTEFEGLFDRFWDDQSNFFFNSARDSTTPLFCAIIKAKVINLWENSLISAQLEIRPIKNAWSHRSHATVNYTPIGVEPHEPTRGVWPIVAVANDSQSHLVASSI